MTLETISEQYTHRQFNCQDFDFQASSQIILNKHNNLKHKEKNSVQESTFKCSNCDKQFSAMWNLKNHIRDEHETMEECIWFKKGSCRFLEKKVCWNKHTVLLQNKAESNVKNIQCHNYKETFKRVSHMMIHKKNKHPEKVRLCRNGESCDFKNCWYRHSNTHTSDNENITNSRNQTEVELNFHKGQNQTNPSDNIN